MSFSASSFRRPLGLLLATSLAVPIALVVAFPAAAAVPTVGLGVLSGYSVLGGSGVTNTGPTILSGSLGSSPTPAISGFDVPGGPGIVVGGSIYGTPAADPARAAAGTAYLDAAGRSGTPVADVELGGKTLVSGVYTAGSTGTFGLTSTLTLTGDVDDVWIFQTDSTLITAAASKVVLAGGAQACNVFWKVGSSATLGASSTFAGTILAAATITLGDDVSVVGRLIAGTSAVTLINDVVTRPSCAIPGGTAAAAEAAAQAAAAASAAAEAAAATAASADAAAAVALAESQTAASLAEAARLAGAEAQAFADAQVPRSPEADAAALAADEAAELAELAAAEALERSETAAAEAVTAREFLDAAIARAEALAELALAAREAAAIVRPALAATGEPASPVLLGIGALVLLLGLGIIAARRRSRLT